MNKNPLIAIALTSLLCACVTPYVDPRTPEEQKAEFNGAINILHGDYIVKDSRNNDGGFTKVTITPDDKEGIMATFVTGNGDMFYVYGGEKCSGGYKPNTGYASLFCNNEKFGDHISMLEIRRVLTPETIPAGPGLFNYQAMKIEGGYYLNYYLGNNGRPHIYALEKKSPQAPH
ncbi:MAG TPA: hypothetical protein VFP33_11630 [Gallionella sp.]|nr:hypothetical protein [Gallionella sp.]